MLPDDCCYQIVTFQVFSYINEIKKKKNSIVSAILRKAIFPLKYIYSEPSFTPISFHCSGGQRLVSSQVKPIPGLPHGS